MKDKSKSRRRFLGAVASGALLSAPYIGNAKAGETITWKVQTSWPVGIGLKIFKDWCASIKNSSGGEIEFIPVDEKDAVGAFQLLDATKNGVLHAMNSFTIYWAKRMPLAAFLSSYPLGLRNPHEWDTFYYGLGGLEIARAAFAKFGVYYVGPIQHGPNIIHSKIQIFSIDDFKDRTMRLPGGMIAEVFKAAGAKTILLPGDKIFEALENGTIDIADYVGPAVNYALGFHKVTEYISMGPPGFMSIYQPVDLMDFIVGMDTWHSLPPHLKLFVEKEVHVYSRVHFSKIQKADQDAWKLFEDAGTTITRLSNSDVYKFTELAVPIWFKWANKDKNAARAFKIQLDYMMSGSLDYVTPLMIKGHSINA